MPSREQLVARAVRRLLRLDGARGPRYHNARVEVLADLADSGRLGSYFPEASPWTREGGPIPPTFRVAISSHVLARFVK